MTSLSDYAARLKRLEELHCLKALKALAQDEDTMDYVVSAIDVLQSATNSIGMAKLLPAGGHPLTSGGPGLTMELMDDVAWIFAQNTKRMMDQSLLAKDLYRAVPTQLLDDLLLSLSSYIDRDCY